MAVEKHIEKIRVAVDFIEKNLTSPISVQDVCEISPLSIWEFQRCFRLCTGDSIGGYIRARRLTRSAEDLLENSTSRILDIAIRYNFGSQEAFTRAFKRMFNVPPGEVESIRSEIRLKQKVMLTEQQLIHNLLGIQREPKFVQFEKQVFVGLEVQIPSPFGDDPSYQDQVSELWKEFNPRRKEIPHRERGSGYGIALSPSGGMTEDFFPYMASVRVMGSADFSVPPGMKKVELPAMTCAAFEKRGQADKTRMSMDYIYGYWLSQSGYERAKGFDFEIFDSRFEFEQESPISTYYLPVISI